MRTRFPPSPTGMLHVGSLRTALYNELLARKEGGKFILRIEDTDQEREVPGAVENFLDCFKWAGLIVDEGVMLKDGAIAQQGPRGPYIQSERTALYREYADKLLASGHAYRCFCTKERLEQMRKHQEERKMPPMYDRTCLKLTAEEVQKRVAAGEPHVIRLNVPQRTISYTDEIRGNVTFQGHTIDDQVLLKSDGFPTYHLANVVDDHLMEIDLVLRGEEWLSSTPKHIILYEALGWAPPRFGHLPLLLNKDKTKLSKRQNSVSVTEYIEKGYLPEALINFLALLGWNPGTEQEIFTKDELIAQFSLERVQKAGAIFDLEKLDWLQGQWIRRLSLDDFVARIRGLVEHAIPEAKSDPLFDRKAALIQERITFFSEAPDMLGYFWKEPEARADLLANDKQKVKSEDLPNLLDIILDTLQEISYDDWTDATLLAVFRTRMEREGLKLGQLLWPLRAALTGREYSPGAVEVAAILGKNESIRRVEKAKAAL